MTTGLMMRPWEALDADVARALRPELDGLADEIIDTIVLDVPDYRRPLEGNFEHGLRTGVHEALRHFIELIEDPVAGRTQDRSVYRGLGRGELRQGRSLDALQAAYRIGARMAWRRWADAGNQAGLDAATLQLLAESIFVYIDEISAQSIEGYAAAQAERAGERERRRQRLFAALVAEPVDEETARGAAGAAAWTVPRSLAAIAVRGTGGAHVAAALGEDAIAVVDGAETLVLWPDPERPGGRALLERELRREVAIGPAVSWRQAGRSLRLARTLLELGRREGAPAEPRWVVDHLRAIALDDPDGVLAELRSVRLRAFEGLTPRVRARLQQTLLAWLCEQGNRAATARALGVHEQTVRYRFNQLRELLGEALEDPDARFELELALRASAKQGAVNEERNGMSTAETA